MGVEGCREYKITDPGGQMSALNSQYKMSEDVVVRKNQDGTMIMMKMDDSNVFFKVQGVSVNVLKGIQDSKGPQDIINEITSEYDVKAAQVEADVEDFLTKLVSKDLLVKA